MASWIQPISPAGFSYPAGATRSPGRPGLIADGRVAELHADIFSHTWLDRGGAERDLMELNGWTSPQMLTRYGASARRSYDRIMHDTP